MHELGRVGAVFAFLYVLSIGLAYLTYPALVSWGSRQYDGENNRKFGELALRFSKYVGASKYSPSHRTILGLAAARAGLGGLVLMLLNLFGVE